MANNHIPLTLEQHQQILYEILYMVDDFCRAHDIPYFLVGGTLLGAVRHQGIIPWDDDADIAMTRENYERFIKLFHAEGVGGYELLDLVHTEGFLFPFAKMRKIFTSSSAAEASYINIEIDIFVYDGCGDTLQEAQENFLKTRNKIQKFANLFLLKFNKSYDCWKSKIVYLIKDFPKDLFMFYPMWIFPHWKKSYISGLISQCTKYSVSDAKYSACIVWGIYGKGEIQLSSSFLNLEKMRFGTRYLPVPSGWHAYLSGLYGDYMTPPPENKRRIKHASYLQKC